MNLTDTQKHAISEKLNRAIVFGPITPSEAARNLGIIANYVSMMRNPQNWHKCAKGGWEAAETWYNSGQNLSEYSAARGRVMIPVPLDEQKLIAVQRQELKEAKTPIVTAPLAVKPVIPEPGQQFTDTARLKVALDIEINLVVNGKKVEVK